MKDNSSTTMTFNDLLFILITSAIVGLELLNSNISAATVATIVTIVTNPDAKDNIDAFFEPKLKNPPPATKQNCIVCTYVRH